MGAGFSARLSTLTVDTYPSERTQRRVIGAISHAMHAIDHHFSLRIYWEDTDAGGVVFFANYLKFFERARTEWLRELGFCQETWRAAGHAFVVTDIQVRYLSPARLDDQVDIRTTILQTGQASLKLNQEARRDSVLLAQSSVRLGFVDVVTLRPRRFPSELLTLIA